VTVARTRLFLLVVLVSLASAPALAQDSWNADGAPAYLKPGLYGSLGFALGIDMALEDELEDQGALSTDVDEGLGFKAKIGYRYIKWLGAEFEVEHLRDIDVEVFGNDFIEMEYTTFTLNTKAYLPFGRFQPFALIGIGMMHVEVDAKQGSGSADETALASRFGGGIDVYVLDNVAMVFDASYVLPADDLDDLDYLSLGFSVQYKF
jgi:opacity protein-like surface antigen